MKINLASIVLLAAPFAAAAAEVPCPALPEAAQLQWQHHRFDESSYSCYAVTRQNHLAFGFLVAPSFGLRPQASEQVAAGQIGKQSVNWYRTAAQSNSWQSVVKLEGTPGRVAHVFVPAPDEPTFRHRLSLVESLVLAPQPGAL